MATEWYYQSMGEKIGPFNASELRQRAVAGELTHDTLVTRTGTEDWVTADRVKGLLAPPSKDELEKIELRAEEILPSLNAENQSGGDFLSVKDQDAIKIFGFLFLGFLMVYMFVLNYREKDTYVSTPDNRDTSSSSPTRDERIEAFVDKQVEEHWKPIPGGNSKEDAKRLTSDLMKARTWEELESAIEKNIREGR